MKKIISLFICILVLFNLAGCGDNSSSDRTGKQPTGVNDVLESGIADEDSKKDNIDSQASKTASDNDNSRQNGVNEDAPDPEPINEFETAEKTEGIDVDLTALSGTMVYSEVYNMLVSPENYIGKTVKMDGSFAIFHDDVSDKYYFACIIADATACCSQGIEFVLTEDYSYPDDYPNQGEDICVIGVFDTYKEGDYTYCTLRNARIV
ncbi:MAG: hypothetical protein IKR26_03840 [Lachnospiraceae bacterium]|nr:hypothetical protein [Lachnospiraceae bacterium]